MPSTKSRYEVVLTKATVEDEARLVTLRWPVELEAAEALEALAAAKLGTITGQGVGRLTGERTTHMVVAFSGDTRANAVTFAGFAERVLADAERRAHLRLYCFEAVFGPPVYLALDPTRRADEAFAILAGAELADEDDDITEADLELVPKERAQQLRVRAENQTLWEAFCDKTEPCIVAAGDPES